MTSTAFTGATRLRQLLSDTSKIVVAPGVYDGLTARLALAAGFECLYMMLAQTGAGTSMSRLGMADLGLATFNDMHTNAAMIASLSPSTPVIADADTGYGGPIMVSRTVTAYARSGVAGLHIEDQVQEKRCGHLMGKQLVEREIWYSRLRAAVAARDALGSEMVIIARTDARAVHGFEDAVERLKGAKEIGADVLFLEALETKDECKRACDIFKGTPLLLNMVPGGKTPNLGAQEAQDLGFGLMIFPGLALEAVIKGVEESMKDLKIKGAVGDQAGNIRRAFEVCGLQEAVALDKKAGGKAFESV